MKKKDAFPIDIILDSIADGVFTIDLEKNITSFNKAAETITGIPRDQAMGQKCFDVFHASICQTACAVDRTMQSGKPIIDMPVSILNSRGHVIPISVSTAVVRNSRGDIIGGVETFRDLSTIEQMKRELNRQYSYRDIISKNHEIHILFNILPDIAESDSTVLIQGPSGSGKELFARAIHNMSRRAKGPYVVVNCGALPESLLESEMFGYCKGAFTDAKQDKPGRFARADGGTLFLDEIGDISPALQVKLLRVLQEGEYEPLGSARPVKADVRIIAATHQNIEALIRQGRFTEDFYYRINVIRITIPPLSQRREDIPLLVDHFLRRHNTAKGKKITGVSSEVMEFLMVYDFPGNVRELENIMERACILCRDSLISAQHLPPELRENIQSSASPLPATGHARHFQYAQRQVILAALNRHGGSRTKTARELGIDKSTLWRKMKKLGLLS